MPELVLLTHATEADRPSNTGRLVQAVADTNSLRSCTQQDWQVRTVVWQRKAPDALLLQRCADPQTTPYVLLYPGLDACVLDVDTPTTRSDLAAAPVLPAGFILLDATWQQAQKMYNQSPYLHGLTKWQLQSDIVSTYQLRRNQRQQGWCTAEIVLMLWQHFGLNDAAARLTERFQAFNQR